MMLAAAVRRLGLGLLLCGLLVFAVLQSRTPLRNWPICTMFGLQDAKRN